MDEVWERAVETALHYSPDCSSARILTLDGAVKCMHGRLPPPSLLEKFHSLEHLSIANVGVSSLERFPRLRNLQKLILSDNRIAGGLEFLVEAGLHSLRDLDLSNNRIQFMDVLAPLAQLRLVSLDLYECPVTRIKDYRSRVFGMINSLKYLDKMDADENERPESDEDEDEEEDEDEDPGSGEVDEADRSGKLVSGSGTDVIVDPEEDEESDSDEEVTDAIPLNNGLGRGSQIHLSNGIRVAASRGGEDEENAEDEEYGDLGEERDAEDDDENVVEVHETEDSEEDGIEEDEDEDDESSSGYPWSTEEEIDGHEQGEEDPNGEIGEEEEQEIEGDGEYGEDDSDDEEEEFGSDYLVQPIRGQVEDVGCSDGDLGNDDDEGEEVEDAEDVRGVEMKQPPSCSQIKRMRENVENGDCVEDERSSKRQ